MDHEACAKTTATSQLSKGKSTPPAAVRVWRNPADPPPGEPAGRAREDDEASARETNTLPSEGGGLLLLRYLCAPTEMQHLLFSTDGAGLRRAPGPGSPKRPRRGGRRRSGRRWCRRRRSVFRLRAADNPSASGRATCGHGQVTRRHAASAGTFQSKTRGNRTCYDTMKHDRFVSQLQPG